MNKYSHEEQERINAAWREILERNAPPQDDGTHCGRCGRCRDGDFHNCKNRARNGLLTHPYTGEPRDWRDVNSDPEGHLRTDGWTLGDYDNGEKGCEKCGRFRLCLCENGKHRCEKCNWSPEEERYVEGDEYEGF